MARQMENDLRFHPFNQGIHGPGISQVERMPGSGQPGRCRPAGGGVDLDAAGIEARKQMSADEARASGEEHPGAGGEGSGVSGAHAGILVREL